MSTRLNKIASSLEPTKQRIVKSTASQLEPSVFGPGVTGADLSVPVFDGTSSDPHDYLIDLETDSMERYPDIRSYFHWVGDLIQDATTPPSDIEARKAYDDDLVRRGRLHLKNARAQGQGLYLSKDRDFLALNIPGGRWYRMPIAGIVEMFLRKELEPKEEEGAFASSRSRNFGKAFLNQARASRGRVLLTNIRSAVWWGDSLRPGIVPGTLGWHDAVYTLYWPDRHPSSVMWGGMGGRSAIIDELWIVHSSLFDVDKARAIVEREWYNRDDETDDGEGSGDSEDENEPSPNRISFDPVLLAEIAPDKPKRNLYRFK